jgi:hypothetical protein
MEAEVTISSIVFIVILIVPGVFFKRFYFRGQFTKQFSSGLFADRLITSIFWGLIVQLITFLLFNKFMNLTYEKCKSLISTVYGKLAENAVPDFSADSLLYILGYLFTSILVAAALGCLAHGFIRFFKIDSKFEVFRFANQWNYYFRGDSLNFGEFRARKTGKVLSTLIDVVMENGEGATKMFSGFLTQYQISSETGQLEVLYLTDAKRYSKSNTAFKPVDGDCLIIPYNRVIDMNIRYNVRVVTNNIYRKVINATINILSGAALWIIFIYPWFLEVSYWRIILGILCSLIVWVSALTLLNHFFKAPGTTSTLNYKGIIALLGAFILFGYTALSLFDLLEKLQFWNH